MLRSYSSKTIYYDTNHIDNYKISLLEKAIFADEPGVLKAHPKNVP